MIALGAAPRRPTTSSGDPRGGLREECVRGPGERARGGRPVPPAIQPIDQGVGVADHEHSRPSVDGRCRPPAMAQGAGERGRARCGTRAGGRPRAATTLRPGRAAGAVADVVRGARAAGDRTLGARLALSRGRPQAVTAGAAAAPAFRGSAGGRLPRAGPRSPPAPGPVALVEDAAEHGDPRRTAHLPRRVIHGRGDALLGGRQRGHDGRGRRRPRRAMPAAKRTSPGLTGAPPRSLAASARDHAQH